MQAAAVVSGAAALLLDENPKLSPDQIKALLVSEALPLKAESRCQGGGAVDVLASAKAEVPFVGVTALAVIIFGLEGLIIQNLIVKLAVYLVTAIPILGIAWFTSKKV